MTRFKSSICALLVMMATTGGGARADDKVRIGIGVTADFLALYMAMDHDLFQKQGIAVDVVQMAGSAASNQVAALVAGSLDVIGTGAPTLIQGYDSGLPIIAFANASVLPTFGKLGIIARTGSGITKPSDLAGKRIAVNGLNTILQFAAKNWLAENGVPDKSIKWMEVLSPQMIDLMKSGQFDAAVMTDPFFTVAREQGVGIDVGQVYSKAPAGTSLGVYIGRQDWVMQHPAIVTKLRSALAEGMAMAKANPDAATESLAKHTMLPQAALKLVGMPNLETNLGVQNLTWWVKVLESQDILATTVDPAALISNTNPP